MKDELGWGDTLPQGKVSPGTRYQGDKINQYTGFIFESLLRYTTVICITGLKNIQEARKQAMSTNFPDSPRN